MGVHESQSLLWEKQVGQGRALWQHHLTTLQQDYGFLAGVDLDTFEFGLNLVDLHNFIRVDADELTYPLHVILRYELERDLIGGTLQVADLPRAWNQKMQDYLGITPPDDALGCLQDVHWSAGLFGYFPCYTLGALYAAQLYRAAIAHDATIEPQLSRGDTAPLLAFLRQRVHRPGSRWPTDELMTQATGEPLNPAHFMAYAEAKYSRLYRLVAE
jgi:carboxypeptidase Taq